MAIVPQWGIGITGPGKPCPIPAIPPPQTAHGVAPCGPNELCYFDVELEPFSTAEVEALASQQKRLCVYGRVDYRDVFDESHRTRFCFWYDPKAAPGAQPPSFHWCDEHNDLS